MNIIEVLVPAQEIAWLPWAVQYFFYIGSAYAAAILFLIAILFHEQTSHHFRAALALTMAIGAIVGPLALTGDLHQPGRAWHFYVHFTPWSWMSLGSLFLPLFSALTVLTAWLYLRHDLSALQSSPNMLMRKLGWLTLGKWQISHKQLVLIAAITSLSGLSIALYTGTEIAVLTSRPLWHQPAAPLLWFTSAFLGAIGFTVFIWMLFPTQVRQQLRLGDLHIVHRTTTICALLSFTLVPIWASNGAYLSLYLLHDWVNHLAVMTISLVLCFIVGLMEFKARTARLRAMLLASITLGTTWVIRWFTMMEVQTIPHFDVGPYPYELPLGSSGLLSIVGMFGLWIALAFIASEIMQQNKRLHSISPIYFNQPTA